MSMRIDIVKREQITLEEREQMFTVFSRYYENIDPLRFKKDMAAKNWIIQLRNSQMEIVGFSTIQTYLHSGRSGSAMVIYSGDTIVDLPYRTNGDLAGAFGHFILRMIKENQEMPVYWLLTSKGVRTYRFLPVFFKTFFPGVDQKVPPRVKKFLDEAATEKFGEDYSSATQVISHYKRRDWLCPSEHDPLLLKRSDPHIGFFLRKNPGFDRGDELACISEMTEENLNPRAWRVIEHTQVKWRD